MDTNPFTQRARITDPSRFAGRWGELSLIFERIESGRPVLITGAPGIGKSSLLTHVMQSAATNLDAPELHAYYLNLAEPGAEVADVYRVVVGALGGRGTTLAALEVALLSAEAEVLLCLDNVQAAAGWGALVLDELARVGRGGRLLVVAACEGVPPPLGERYALINLGAFAAPEVRLLADSYLDGTDVAFSPRELRELTVLSAGHPAYLQRAAYHLFQSKLHPGADWRAAYLDEARTQPIPGAPLPPEVFAGERNGGVGDSTYNEDELERTGGGPAQLPQLEQPPVLLVLVSMLLTALAYAVSGSVVIAVLVGVLSVVIASALGRRAEQRKSRREMTTPEPPVAPYTSEQSN